MTCWRIGELTGVYRGDTREEAIEDLARNMGYASAAELALFYGQTASEYFADWRVIEEEHPTAAELAQLGAGNGRD